MPCSTPSRDRATPTNVPEWNKLGRSKVIGIATKLIFLAALSAAAWYVVPHVEQLAHDPRMVWVALLPVAYVVGMVVLLHE